MSVDLNQQVSLGAAQASWDGQQLTLGTGTMTRVWRLVPGGLSTVLLRDEASGHRWVDGPGDEPDWSIFALTSEGAEAELLDVRLRAVEEDTWTSPHVEAVVTLRYAATDTELRYRVWAYPDGPGLRTQVGVRWIGDRDKMYAPSFLGGSWGESLRFDTRDTRRLAAGYYNDTQHRNFDHTPMLREQVCRGAVDGREVHDWANLLRITRSAGGTDEGESVKKSLPGAGAGLTFVKESHKCVNQFGVDTGEFVVEPGRVMVTGLALERGDWHEREEFVDGWATWTVLHRGDDDHAALAVKRFDRCRYPLKPQRDLYAMANTWGSGGAGWRSRAAATQENVLRELEVAADLGLDGVQIDDGWQCAPGDPERPFDVDWSAPNGERFPDGWAVVREAAERLGVPLGLWAPARVDAEQLITSIRDGGFRCLKLDFMHLHNRDAIDENVGKARRIIEQVGGDLRINWDVTENNPRVGFFYARECGCIFYANRENGPTPWRSHVHIRWTPRLTLRETWELAHHLNLNQFQITFQNKDLVEPDVTNVQEHSHGYLLAITLMALPVFFQEVQKLSPEARDEIRPIMQAYRAHREAMNRGYVFPLGAEPNDHRWAGFESYDPQTGGGYVLLLRELHNDEPTKRIRLPFLAGQTLATTDVLTGETASLTVDARGEAEFTLPEPGSFMWLRFQLKA